MACNLFVEGGMKRLRPVRGDTAMKGMRACVCT